MKRKIFNFLESIKNRFYKKQKIEIDYSLKPCIGYYNKKKICFIKYYNEELLHRENGPALTYYHKNGNLISELYIINGELHRVNEPAYIRYHKDGSVELVKYCYNDLYHREDGPAIIEYDINGKIIKERYYINGNDIDLENCKFTYDEIDNLIKQCNDENELSKFKLIINVKFNRNKTLLNLIDSKLIMFQLT